MAAYGDTLARNIAAARTRNKLSQSALAERMQALGFSQWVPQTVSKSERNARRVLAEEVLGLAICLGTSMARLLSPLREDKPVDLPSGQSLRIHTVEGYVTGEWVTDERILWHENKPWRNPVPGEYPDEDGEG